MEEMSEDGRDESDAVDNSQYPAKLALLIAKKSIPFAARSCVCGSASVLVSEGSTEIEKCNRYETWQEDIRAVNKRFKGRGV